MGCVRIRHLSPRTNQGARVNLYPPLGGLQRLLSLLLPFQVLDSSAASLLVADLKPVGVHTRFCATIFRCMLGTFFWNLPISSRCLVSRLFTCAIVDFLVYSLGINHRHLYSILVVKYCSLCSCMLTTFPSCPGLRMQLASLIGER
jgi:hypothetical protein